MPMVEVLKPFNRQAYGEMVHPPEVIDVGDTRAEELKRLGLARDPLIAKVEPAPQNKIAPTPARGGPALRAGRR